VADEYERRYMQGRGAVLYRDKATIPRWSLGLVGGLLSGGGAVGSAVMLAAGAALLSALLPLAGGAALAAFVTGAMVVFASGRLVVSEGELEIRIGPAGRRVPIDEIEAVEITASPSRARGLGVKKVIGGTIYDLMGDPARAVRLTLRDGGPLYVVPKDPDGLAEALEGAMSAGSVVARVRVEAGADVEEGAEAPVERDAERERAGG
jgi:hypothetical protein